MAFIQVVVNNKVTSERESTFGDKDIPKDISDTFKGKNIKVLISSRERRKQNAN